MNCKKIKSKVAKKTAKMKQTVARKCGKTKKACAVIGALLLVLATGCATSEQPITTPNMMAGKSETMHANLENSNIYLMWGVKRANTTSNSFEFAESSSVKPEIPDITILGQAQSMESSGSESYSPSNAPVNSPTATPSNTVSTDITARYNDALAAASSASRSVLGALGDGLGSVLDLMASKKSGTVKVTKKDGTAGTVVCENGQCSFCADGSCTPNE